jgi:hypothetical protein
MLVFSLPPFGWLASRPSRCAISAPAAVGAPLGGADASSGVVLPLCVLLLGSASIIRFLLASLVGAAPCSSWKRPLSVCPSALRCSLWVAPRSSAAPLPPLLCCSVGRSALRSAAPAFCRALHRLQMYMQIQMSIYRWLYVCAGVYKNMLFACTDVNPRECWWQSTCRKVVRQCDFRHCTP